MAIEPLKEKLPQNRPWNAAVCHVLRSIAHNAHTCWAGKFALFKNGSRASLESSQTGKVLLCHSPTTGERAHPVEGRLRTDEAGASPVWLMLAMSARFSKASRYLGVCSGNFCPLQGLFFSPIKHAHCRRPRDSFPATHCIIQENGVFLSTSCYGFSHTLVRARRHGGMGTFGLSCSGCWMAGWLQSRPPVWQASAPQCVESCLPSCFSV